MTEPTVRSALFVASGRHSRPVPVQRQQSPAGLADAVTAVRVLVPASIVPVHGGKAANVAMAACPGLAPGWVGTGSFGGFVAEHLPALRWTGRPTHGYLYEP